MSQDSKRITEAQVRREFRRIDRQTANRRARIGAAVILALALLAGAAATRYLFVALDIRSDGMADVLRGGDVVLCVRSDAPDLQSVLPQLQSVPGRGALALVRYSDNGMRRLTVRRVIALGGDEVDVDSDGRSPTPPIAMKATKSPARSFPAARWKTPLPTRLPPPPYRTTRIRWPRARMTWIIP